MPPVFSKFRRTHSGVFFKLLMKIVYIYIPPVQKFHIPGSYLLKKALWNAQYVPGPGKN